MHKSIQLIMAMAAGLIGGCATQRPSAAPSPRTYGESPAASLAFTPPMALVAPPVDLARELRQPGAFVGFETTDEVYSYVRQDDRFTDDTSSRFIRQSVTQRYGHSSR